MAGTTVSTARSEIGSSPRKEALSAGSIHSSLRIGAIPGTFEQGRWTMTAEDVDAAEQYFREIAAPGGHKGGAAALEQAKRRSR